MYDYNEGQIIVVTIEEYSDYAIHGYYYVRKSFNDAEVKARYNKTMVGQTRRSNIYDHFLEWLLMEGYIVCYEKEEVVEFNIGMYGKIR